MKLASSRFPDFLSRDLSFSVRSMLFFGPHPSLLEFKVDQVRRALSSQRTIAVKTLESLPVSLETFTSPPQISLFGPSTSSSTLIIIPGAKDAFLPVIEKAQGTLAQETTLVLLMGPGLPTASKLVKFYEQTPGFYALGVYEENLFEKKLFLQSIASEVGLTLLDEELTALGSFLPSDAPLMRTELEKLSLYKTEGSPVTIDDIHAVIHVEIHQEIEMFIHWLCLGNRSLFLKAYAQLKDAGIEDMLILRGVTFHFMRLLHVLALVKRGQTLSQAIETLKPRLFFKAKDRFLTHCSSWTPGSLLKGLSLLKEGEILLKTSPSALRSQLERLFLRLSQLLSPSHRAPT